MSRLGDVVTLLAAHAGRLVNRTLVLPLLIFYPTHRCNSRCLSCDWWKSTGEGELTRDEVDALAAELPALGTRLVAFSGGEPLVRPDVFELAALFRQRGLRLHLLTSGLLLGRYAREVADLFDRVTVSLDGSTSESYQRVRGVAGLAALEAGIARLKAAAPRLPITARATLHAANFRELPRLVEKALAMGLDGISFLPADVCSDAFGRTAPPTSGVAEPVPGSNGPRRRLPRLLPVAGGSDQAARLMLTPKEIAEFSAVVAHTARELAEEFASGFVAESARRLRRLPRYFGALRGTTPFPRVRCNAPWYSAVVEADGTVRPCFFHRPIGNLRQAPLEKILRDELVRFRQTLRVRSNSVCQRCVCPLNVGWRHLPWSM
jgi:MoaA/NifB/PqqE/SkfB family radical SAM enzyme